MDIEIANEALLRKMVQIVKVSLTLSLNFSEKKSIRTLEGFKNGGK